MKRHVKPHIAIFRFYEELNDFLPPDRQKRDITYRFDGSPSVKDAIEAQGIPHAEVDLILVNGESVTFSHRIGDGDRVSVYPVFESLDIGAVTRLRPAPLRTPRFILDVHLGKLTGYLRLLGFDCRYERDLGDHAIVDIAACDDRIILTRDRGLLKHASVTRGYWIRSHDPRTQAREVVRRFDLASSARPFHRCLSCNGIVHNVVKDKVLQMLAQDTVRFYDQFSQCGSCGKVYWKGSHYTRMKELVRTITDIPPGELDS